MSPDGNSVRILVNGDEFFPAMLKSIRAAKKTISLETYIWAPGRISDEFIAAPFHRRDLLGSVFELLQREIVHGEIVRRDHSRAG